MNKSLAPLIIFFALIVLMTVITINSKYISPKEKQADHKNTTEQAPVMKLSPFIPSAQERKTSLKKQSDNFKFDSKKALWEAKRELKKGEIEKAEDKLKTILIFEPENPDALSILGNILYRTQKYREAETIFKKQINAQNASSSVYNNLGAALAKQNKLSEAIKFSKKALEISPESPETLLNLSGMYSVMGDTKNAVEYFRKAYERLGARILNVSDDHTLDNVREEPEFKAILKEAEEEKKDQGLDKKKTETGKKNGKD